MSDYIIFKIFYKTLLLQPQLNPNLLLLCIYIIEGFLTYPMTIAFWKILIECKLEKNPIG